MERHALHSVVQVIYAQSLSAPSCEFLLPTCLMRRQDQGPTLFGTVAPMRLVARHDYLEMFQAGRTIHEVPFILIDKSLIIGPFVC